MADNNLTCPVGDEYPWPSIPPANITQNFTFPKIWLPEPYPDWEVSLKIAANAIAIIMAVVGNLLIIITVALSKDMHRTTFYYIVNLAISDLLMANLMWIHLQLGITHEFPFGNAVCKIFPFFQILALTASTMFLTAIAVDRFFSIVYPWQSFSKGRRRVWKHIVTITFIWVLAMLVAVPMLKVRWLIVYQWANYRQSWCEERWPRFYTEPDPDATRCSNHFDMPGRRIYYSMSVILMYIIPVIVMTIAYSMISYTLHKRKIPGEPTERNVDIHQKTRKRVVRMLIVVFIVFLVCWTPQEFIVLYNAFDPEGATFQLSDGLKYGAIYIAYFNSALNPILYAGLNSKFRQGFKNIVKCSSLKKNTVSPTNATTLANGGGASPVQRSNGTALAPMGESSEKKENTCNGTALRPIEDTSSVNMSNGTVKMSNGTALSPISESSEFEVQENLSNGTIVGPVQTSPATTGDTVIKDTEDSVTAQTQDGKT